MISAAELNGKWGYINQSGEVLIQIKYDNVQKLFWSYNRYFENGLATVELNGKNGYIDRQGKIVIPVIYDEAYPFSRNKAKVKLGNDIFYINKAGKKIEE